MSSSFTKILLLVWILIQLVSCNSIKYVQENENLLKERLAKARTEMEFVKEFDIVVVNDDLEHAKKEMIQRVKAFTDQT